MKQQILAFLSAGLLFLSGCATQAYSNNTATAERIEYGRVTSIMLQPADKSGPVNLGTVIGGVAGGIIGHQFGGGSGQTALTIAGAVGGAIAGNQIQKSREKDRYEIRVRLDSGEDLVVNQVAEGEFRVGDRVRVVNDRVYRN